MTNVQKAFCILLSMCFFATLAVLPGTFFTGENVYRHLPLYRFLEKRAHMSSYEDIETYKKIAGENGKYLGERAQSEQLLAEKGESEELQIPESTPVPKETAIPSKTVKSAKISESAKILESEQTSKKSDKTPKPKKITASPENHETDKSQKPQESAAQNDQNIQNSTETIAAAVPHPIIDLSPEKLADYNYLLGQFYIVDSNTEADAVQINAGDFLKQDLKITKETDTPQILIYHSHSQETFADSRPGERADTVIGLGDDLQELLGFEIDGGFQAMDYSALTTSLAENKLDIGAAALCATDERKEVMKFSDIYCDSGQVVMVNKSNDEGIKSVDDLKGKKVAVEKGTASHTYASKNLSDADLEVHDTITTAYESLEQKKVDAVIQDGPGANFYIKTTPDSNLEVVGDEFNQGQAPYCVAISKECKYYDEINAAVKVLIKNGTTDELYAKWCE